MGELYAVAGARIYIGGARSAPSADLTEADFADETYTEIDGWETAGAYGDAFALITTALINRGRDLKQKGTANAGQMQNNFAILPSDVGQIALKAAARTKYNYPIKIMWDDEPPPRSSTVTMTIATPGVITWTAHGLEVGDKVSIATTGALPTGLTAGTEYFVKTAPSADTFTLAATAGGSAITTSGSQSGVHTATTAPTGTVDQFVALVMGAPKQGGNANTARMLQSTLELNSNIVETLPTGA
jgi:hypothetical protein